MMSVAEIPLGEYLPDQPNYTAPGVILARNAIPSPGGYRPLRAAVLSDVQAVSQTVYGARAFRDADGEIIYVSGTDKNLLVRQGATLYNTPIAAVGSGQFWQFAQFNNFIVAVSPVTVPQYLTDLSSDTTWSALPGSPPTSRVVGRLGDFLVLGDVSGARSRVQWSAFNNPTAPWVTDRRNQSGFIDLPPKYGAVTAIVDDPFPMVFQERAVWRFQPVGGATVFQRAPVAEGVGAVSPGAVVTRGQSTYFLSDHGFYETNGGALSPIGAQRVNRTFLEDVASERIGWTHGVVDWLNECIVWAYSSAAGGGGFDRQIIYSYGEGRWSHGASDLDYLTEASSDGLSLEDLETQFGSLENVPGSLDDQRYASRGDILGAWVQDGSGNSILSRFNGDSLATEFRTREFQPSKGRRVSVLGVRPVVENPALNSRASVAVRNPLAGSAAVFSPYTEVGADGFAPQRADGHFAAVSVQIPAASNWSNASVIQARFRTSGRR